MTYGDSDFDILTENVYWRGSPLRTYHGRYLTHARTEDITYLRNLGFCSPQGDPALYEVLSDMSRDCDEILIYDGQGNLLHRMEDKDGLHRGTTQKVHGSAAGSSSGSQSTGTGITLTSTGSISITGAYIAQGPGYISWSYPGSPNTYSINNSPYYGASQAMTVPGSTPGYAFGHGYSGYSIQQLPPGGITWVSAGPTVSTEPKKKVKDEGIRVGEIVAYRCWPIKNGFLWSTAADRAWAPGEPMKAGENHLRDGLGVYAFKDMSRVIQNMNDVVGVGYGEGVAFGSISLWGEIIEHEIGYRAQCAAIRSIDFVRGGKYRPHNETLIEVRALYKVEGK